MNKLIDKLDGARLQKFFYFLAERQNIYWARQEGKPRPWTKDRILQRYLFCNVYRELDRGTQYVINNILPVKEAGGDKLFKTLIYRMFNEPRTYEFLQKPLNGIRFDGREAARILDRKHAAGIRIFRGAWMTSGANIKGSKAAAYCMEMQYVSYRRADLFRNIKAMTAMEEVWERISQLRWFGGFSAYQVVLDLSYLPEFRNRWQDYDTWVYPGPGAKLGLMWLCGEKPVRRKGSGSRAFFTYDESCKLMMHLRDRQDDYFQNFGCKFRRWNDMPLDLHNIEFSLCEFNKYMRAHYGGKKKKFSPYGEQQNLF